MSGIGAVFLAGVLAQDARTPEFTKYEIARERVGHKVVVDAVLQNPHVAELSDAKVTVLYFDGDDEIRRTPAVAVPKIAPGKSAAFKIEVAQVPNFSRYEVYLEYRGTLRLYLGADPAKPPVLRKPSPARLTLESERGVFALGEYKTTASVKNEGETEADDPTLRLQFAGPSGAVVHQAWVKLDSALPPATLASYEVSVPAVPAHASVKATLISMVAEGLSLGDSAPALAKEVALRQCRVDRMSAGVARVSGLLANGTAKAVIGVQAVFQLGRLEVPYALPGQLGPGETRSFEVFVPDCPPIETAGFTLGFEDSARGLAPPPRPSARRTASEALHVGQVRIPPVPEKTAEAKFVDSATGPQGFKAEIRGLLVVDGMFLKNGKYTGDVYLFRVAFTDVKGQPVQPTGTFSGTIYDGATTLKKVQRIVTPQSWRVDASRVNSQTVADDTMAYDAKTKELWVAFHRCEGPFEKPRADLEFEVPGKGVWAWSGLSGKWQGAPRWPDKPAK